MLNVLLGWQLSTFHGWGVYGLNLALHWSTDPAIVAASAKPFLPSMVAVDALRATSLAGFRRETAELQSALGKVTPGSEVRVNAIVLDPAGLSLQTTSTVEGVRVRGRPSVAVAFLESDSLPADALERAKAYPLIVAGSTWNEQALRAMGVENVTTILQGVDPTAFHPAPKLGLLRDRFLVFSGGKLEARKGQDIALKAFAIFAQRHPDALLVTAWQSAWASMADELPARGLVAPMVKDSAGRLDLAAWAAASGVPAGQFLNVGTVPNPQLPGILREIDIGLFPNRCEGGTNLVAMEAMACGVPCILSANTGHLDLIDGDNCYPLTEQTFGPKGWGESDVDEVVEALERAYADREDARRRGEAGARTLAGLTWQRTAKSLAASLHALQG